MKSTARRRVRLFLLLCLVLGAIICCDVFRSDPLIGTWKYSDASKDPYTEETWLFSFGNSFSVSGLFRSANGNAVTYTGSGTYTADSSTLSITASLSATSALFNTNSYTLNGRYSIDGNVLSFTINGQTYDYYRQ